MRMMHDAQSVTDMTSVLTLRLQVRQERGSEIVYFAVCRSFCSMNSTVVKNLVIDVITSQPYRVLSWVQSECLAEVDASDRFADRGGQAHVYFKCMGKYKWHEMTCFFLQSESFGHCSEGLEILNWMVIDRISCRHIIMFCLCQQKSLVKRVNRVSPEDIQLKNEAAEQVRLLFFIGFWSVLKTIIYMNIQEAIAVSNLHTNFFRMDIIEDWTLLSVRWSAWSQTICKKFEGPGYDYFNFEEIVKKPSTLVIEWYQV